MERKPLSLHEKVLLAVVAIAGIITLFYMFIYQPQRDEITTLAAKVEEKKQEVAQFENFDQTIADTNLQIEDYDSQIREATLKWFPDIQQDDIIKDLEPKMKQAGLNESVVTFVNTQIAQIASMFGDAEKEPTLAEALALAYVGMVQAEATPDPQATPAATGAPDATAAPAPAPASNNTNSNPDDTTLATEYTDDEIDEPLVADDVQKKFDDLHASLKGLSDAELRAKIQEIIDGTVANIQKLTISVTFKNSSYQSIIDFVHQVEASSPAIYITEISYSDSTEDYISWLTDRQQAEIDAASDVLSEGVENVLTEELFNSSFPAASLALSQLEKVEKKKVSADDIAVAAATLSSVTPIDYKDPKRYTGSITLTYFAIAKIHDEQYTSSIN